MDIAELATAASALIERMKEIGVDDIGSAFFGDFVHIPGDRAVDLLDAGATPSEWRTHGYGETQLASRTITLELVGLSIICTQTIDEFDVVAR